MAQIPYAEAMELGLVPRRIEDALNEYYAAQGRYPSGFPRSRGMLAPFFKVPPYLAFQRPSAMRASPFGNPPRTALQPLRFGLGPMGLGLGLSAGSPAISGGGVPVGRRATGTGGPSDVSTLLARGGPQDIEAILRMAEAGLLPPGLLAALRQAGRLPPAPVGRASGPQVSPQAAQQIQQAGSVREAMQTARTVLGISKQVMNDESLLRQIVDPIWTKPPPVSFGGATTPEAQAAFEAQRAGERAPVLSAPAFPIAGPGLSAEVAAGGAPPTDIFNPNVIGGGLTDGAIPAESLAGIEAGVEAGVEAGAGAAGTGAGAASTVGAALPYIGAAFGIANTAMKQDPDYLKAVNAALYAAAPFTFGLTAAVPAILSEGFGGNPEAVQKQRQAMEQSGMQNVSKRFLRDVAGAPDLSGLANVLENAQLGRYESPYDRTMRGRHDPNPVVIASSVRGLSPEQIALPPEIVRGRDPGVGTLASLGHPNMQRTVTSPRAFFDAMLQDPERFQIAMQAGTDVTSVNQALRDAVLQQARRLAPTLDQTSGDIPPSLFEMPKGTLPSSYEYRDSPAAWEFMARGMSPDQAMAAAEQQAQTPAPEVSSGLGSARHGGLATRTGLYRLHEGEIVIPREVAAALGQEDEPMFEQRVAGIAGREPLSREELAKRGVGLLEERTILPPERWYVHSREGAPFQAKANSDPANIWRLATDARQVREALDEGDPVIAVAPEVLRMPIHRAAPLIEQARVAQYEQAGGGIELLDAMARTRGGMAQPAPEAGFMRAAEMAFAAQGRER